MSSPIHPTELAAPPPYVDKEKLWQGALKECNVAFVRKGTPEYASVMAVYEKAVQLAESADPMKVAWKAAVKKVTGGRKKVVRKDDADYPRVKEYFETLKKGIKLRQAAAATEAASTGGDGSDGDEGLEQPALLKASSAKKKLQFVDVEAEEATEEEEEVPENDEGDTVSAPKRRKAAPKGKSKAK